MNTTWKKAITDLIQSNFNAGTLIRLEDLYNYKTELAEIFPKNHYIEAKIRQQCQVLHREGLLRRQQNGEYSYTGGFEHSFKLLSSLSGSVIENVSQAGSLAVLSVTTTDVELARIPSSENQPETTVKVNVAKLKGFWEKLQFEGQLTTNEVEKEAQQQTQEIITLLASLPSVSCSNVGDLVQNENDTHPIGTVQKSGEIFGPGVTGVPKSKLAETELLEQIKVLSERNAKAGEKSRTSKARILIRDRAIADKLKELYAGECQICRFTIELPGNKRYSEHHHLQAKSKGGQDVASNLLVVCPNHHKILDYSVGSLQLSAEGWQFVYKGQSELLQLNKHLGICY